MNNPTETPTRLRNIIADQLGIETDRIVPEARLVDDLGADSLDLVELVMAIEEEFDIEVDDDKAEKLTTVQEVSAYVEKLCAE